MPEFYMIFARKIFFPEFWGARAPVAPVSYAYAATCIIAARLDVTVRVHRQACSRCSAEQGRRL